MTDRELLEAAARAAGIDGTCEEWPSGIWGIWTPSGVWDPLTDDGDALRLAQAINASVQCKDGSDGPGQFGFFSWVEVRIKGEPRMCKEFHTANGSEIAATRRAITRAAAEIGRAS